MEGAVQGQCVGATVSGVQAYRLRVFLSTTVELLPHVCHLCPASLCAAQLLAGPVPSSPGRVTAC